MSIYEAYKYTINKLINEGRIDVVKNMLSGWKEVNEAKLKRLRGNHSAPESQKMLEEKSIIPLEILSVVEEFKEYII